MKSDKGITYKYHNCKLIRDSQVIKDDLWVRNGKILDPEPVFFEEQKRADIYVDCNGGIIVPGFIDVQINGGFGYDFSSDTKEIEKVVKVVAKGLLSTGVTSFCPTIVTSPTNVYHEVLPKIRPTPGGADGAGVLGVHVEGPFISPDKIGAHPLQCIRTFTNGYKTVQEVFGDLSNVCMITLAPELPNASEVIKELSKMNIIVSIGHSTANLVDGEVAVNSGASFITHLFNAMLPFHHRDPGLVGLLTSKFINHKVFYGIIADGIHTHPAALRIAHRTDPSGLVLVTDAISAMGLGEGKHYIGQLALEVVGRQAKIVGTNTLAGSIATMDDCVRRFIKAAGVSLVEGIEAATLHPAQALGIEKQKGTLDFNSDADFLILSDDDQVHIQHTFIAGKCVYSHSKAQLLKRSSQILQ
ncbi:N-acetylglucosamine-6-phosphate deacetylase [Oratosquilla oratoria]|uniref:N-acetylglucosamine-6-phosphate deacetylase n=1 Tax=Oratosquilla oratoria TaxID=337810 RepID=UPI003F762E48